MFSLLAVLFIGFLVIFVAFQNTDVVAIQLLAWTTEVPLAMGLFLAFAGGAVISSLLSASKIIRLNWRLRDLLKAARPKKGPADPSKEKGASGEG